MVEVIAAHERCMVVLSDRHIAVLTNRRISFKSGPQPGWSVLLSEIQNVRGAPGCRMVYQTHGQQLPMGLPRADLARSRRLKSVQSHVLEGLTPAVDLESPLAQCEKCGEHAVAARQQLCTVGVMCGPVQSACLGADSCLGCSGRREAAHVRGLLYQGGHQVCGCMEHPPSQVQPNPCNLGMHSDVKGLVLR